MYYVNNNFLEGLFGDTAVNQVVCEALLPKPLG